jgi:hypothetical protein
MRTRFCGQLGRVQRGGVPGSANVARAMRTRFCVTPRRNGYASVPFCRRLRRNRYGAREHGVPRRACRSFADIPFGVGVPISAHLHAETGTRICRKSAPQFRLAETGTLSGLPYHAFDPGVAWHLGVQSVHVSGIMRSPNGGRLAAGRFVFDHSIRMHRMRSACNPAPARAVYHGRRPPA